jgi:hypothetical protein
MPEYSKIREGELWKKDEDGQKRRAHCGILNLGRR